MRRYTFLYNTFRAITGAHRYERYVFDTLSERDDTRVRRHVCRYRSGLRKLFSPLENLGLYNLLRQEDVVFINSTHAYYFLPLMLLLRLKSNAHIVVFHHHYQYMQHRGWRRLYYMIFEHSAQLTAHRVVAPSPYIVDINRRKYGKKTLFWPIPFPEVKEMHAKPVARHLLFAGTIEPRKGLHLLLESMITLANQHKEGENDDKYSLTIIGETVRPEYYKKLLGTIRSHNLNVTFTGYITDCEKEKLYDTADVFAFPSLLEGYGMVLWEAMSHGLPTVCFDNTAMPYSITHGYNGMMAPTGDTAAFASCLSEICGDRALRDRLSANAFQKYRTSMTYEAFRDRILADTLLIEKK